MTALQTVHTFAVVMPGTIHIFKRVDTHELKLVAIVALIDGLPPEEIGPRICEALNAELMTRGAKDSSNVS